ncbi:MAG: hypothetical protein WC505_00050 [Patescibacteria group bacterium]
MGEQSTQKKSTVWVIVGSIIVVLVAGGVYFVTIDSENKNVEEVNANTINATTSAVKAFNSQGIRFEYPNTFTATLHEKNLPDGEQFEVYIAASEASSVTEVPQVTLSVFTNDDALGVSDFIDALFDRSVVLLPGMLTGTVEDSYAVTDRTEGDNHYTEYTDVETSEHTAFYATGTTMIVILELGIDDAVASAYDKILETLEY